MSSESGGVGDGNIGMTGLILNNPTNPSNKQKAKIKITLQLLKNKKLQPFLNHLRLFELKHSNNLIESNIEASTKLFIAKNYEQYITL